MSSVSTNYVVSSYNVIGNQYAFFDGGEGIIDQDVLAPFKLNYYYRNFVYDPSALNSDGGHQWI